jgi:2-polyprenyl-3-methyl-5-hydroxy-6-metoxy-1,4-benzoquinol methylase
MHLMTADSEKDDTLRSLIERQIQYYDSHASEYDDAFMRRGRWDYGPALNARWLAEWNQIRLRVLDYLSDASQKTALDVACGTGYWTKILADAGLSVTAVDAAPAMIKIAQQRVAQAEVRFEVADVLQFSPTQKYDLVMLGCWLSHVPRALAAGFLTRVANWITSSGLLIVIDHTSDVESFAVGTELPDFQGDVVSRTTSDGRSFCIPKVFYSLEECCQLFSVAGMGHARIFEGQWFFIDVGKNR